MIIPLSLSALALNGIGAYLLIVDTKKQKEQINDDTDETVHKKTMWRNKQFIAFGSIMTLLCIGIAVALSLLYKENTFLFNMKRVCLLSILWPIAYIDVKSYRIPNLFIIAGCVYRVIIFAFELIFENNEIWTKIGTEFIASAALAIAALLCGLAIKNSIGFGDVKLFIVMGLMLGLDGIWSSIFVSLIVSFFISIILLVTKRKNRKDMIPFAPAIMIGTYLSVLLTGM